MLDTAKADKMAADMLAGADKKAGDIKATVDKKAADVSATVDAKIDAPAAEKATGSGSLTELSLADI